MEGKEIIINIKLTGDGAVDVKKLRQALSEFTKETEKNINVRKKNTQAIKGTEKAYINEIKRIKQERAETAKTSKAYISYTQQIEAVERQLRELTEARKTDIQVNADQISNQGLASASLTEFGRLISDAPFGIIGMTNNISQLGSQLGTLSRKTGSAKASFDLLITQLKSGGALILGFQILISLITLYRDEITDFVKGTNTAAAKLKELRKEIEETNSQFDAEGAKLTILNNIINDSTASRESQIIAAEELASVLPGLTAEEILNGDAIGDTTLAIGEYVEQQKIRAEIDAVLDANADVFAKKAKLRAIDLIKDEDEKAAAFDKFVKDSRGFFARFGRGFNDAMAGTKGAFGPVFGLQSGFVSAIFGEGKEKRKVILGEIVKDVDDTTSEVTNLLTALQKEITQPSGGDIPEGGGGRDGVTSFGNLILRQLFGPGFKKRLAKTEEEANDLFFKLQRRIFAGTGLSPFEGQKEQMKAMGDEAKNVMNDFLDSERVQKAVAEKEEDERGERMLQRDLERIEKRKQAQEKLADVIVQQLGKFGQIQSQAFNAQIKRLDTERDIILNNDNLTSQEKDRLLKENDKQSRKIRIQQIKFERDMHMIEMSMELAKLALQGKTLLAGIIGTGAKQTAEATGSISRFLTDLGPVAGPIAYAAMIGGVIAQIITARRKAEQQIKALSGPLAGVSSGGGGSATVSAPSFNVVGATQTSQLAQTIAGSEDKPLRAYVVASDVSTAQELERSTIEGASIG